MTREIRSSRTEKNVKDHIGEVAEGDNIKSPPSDIRDEIASLENRIYHALDAKLENLFSPTSQPQLVALIQSTITRCLQDTGKEIGDATACQIRDMQAAIIKCLTGVTGETRSSLFSSAENTAKNIPAAPVPVSGTTPIGQQQPPLKTRTHQVKVRKWMNMGRYLTMLLR